MRRQWRQWPSLAAAAGILVLVLIAVLVFATRRPPEAVAGAYAEPASCGSCHADIAETYRLTGMARSFSKVRIAAGADTVARLYHAASDRHYTIAARGGALVQRRHQIGFGGGEANVAELTADYVIGSGNHARTYVHRAHDDRLLQLPISWYAEHGAQVGRGPQGALGALGALWAMSPGYDRRAQLDFRRVIDEGCMSCHNAYPRDRVQDDGTGPRFMGALPEGIDCQRCHGPGQRHLDAIAAGGVERARRAIVNPATLDRERQLEVCMQCHLEPTSSPLPFQVRRYGQPPFSYRPGQPLSSSVIYFDHAAATGQHGDKLEDKFEIAGGAYRLRKSACFQKSQMTCTTCHDPHDVPRGEKAVEHYVAACRRCHDAAHQRGVPRVAFEGPRATCLDCHMPKRRAEDAVHVVMTDHFIQRLRPARDLTAPLDEAGALADKPYRGEVVLYYPPALPPTPENELYLALAQVQQGSNLAAGIPRLQRALERAAPDRPEFYYELARAYAKASDHAAVIQWCETALRHDVNFAAALKELAAAATALGQWDRAAAALQRAIALHPTDSHALTDLGNVYVRQRRLDEAMHTLQRALALDPDLPRASNTMGLAWLARDDPDRAEPYFREAIRIQPDLAEAHHNLASLLARRNAYAEAAHHFEEAIRSDPHYADAYHGYGLVLALTHAYPKAIEALSAAVREAPRLARAHTDLADVLALTGQAGAAAREYERAIAANPQEYEAHAGLAELLARQRRTVEAIAHFQAAAQSLDPAIREAARARLAELR